MILQIKLAISPLFGENFSEFVQFIIQTALNAAIVFFVSKFLQNVWDKFVDSYKSAKKKQISFDF